MPALIAAASLLIDYVLTVAVSIMAGVAALTSAFPQWHVNRVEMTIGFVLVLMLGNLRGSGSQDGSSRSHPRVRGKPARADCGRCGGR
jgi:K+ transporter